MIPKIKSRKKRNKMGSIISKPKEKNQKREGLMTQMKSKTEVETYYNYFLTVF